MKPVKVKEETWYNKTFPKYIYNWKDLLVHDNLNCSKTFKDTKAKLEDILKPYLKIPQHIMQRTFLEKFNRVMEDTIENYFWFVLSDILKSGSIVELPNHFGCITLVRYKHENYPNKWLANFMIINSEKLEKHKIHERFTKVSIRNIQLYREVSIRVNENPEKYHTIESFEEEVYGTREKLQMLINL